ncbi:PREDICTED: Golgi-associated plant pathogenesis-related protein 1 [Miniopterus natalensis]|uniref:Golgi-associated plant pathogenesis-related protein 1 n=1 Tax=Miniopterus natalensis TaxID=291302 RepID=UPI0007A6AA87|nr:PREDICTED: Golgi-associated plant pathogenesis-related protein 1 [Miniopterus natalensis]
MSRRFLFNLDSQQRVRPRGRADVPCGPGVPRPGKAAHAEEAGRAPVPGLERGPRRASAAEQLREPARRRRIPSPGIAQLGAGIQEAPAPDILHFEIIAASKQFNNEVLKAHNEYRQQHGVPPLKLCKKLNQEAQQYSEALASTRILKHSPESSRGQCGENLAWASYDQTGKEVADRWYSEIKNYNFQQPGFNSGTGHFTAMVWKNTKKMGVGKASASDGSSFVVARYFPAGNVVNQGYFEENVLPPKK